MFREKLRTGNLLIKHAVKICEGSRESVAMDLPIAKTVSMFLVTTFPNGFVESLMTISRSVATFFGGRLKIARLKESYPCGNVKYLRCHCNLGAGKA